MSGHAARAVVAGILTAALLTGATGCAAGSDLSDPAAARLQQAVAAVVAAADGARYDEALASAAAVRSELERAADAGELSVERYRRIDDALTRTEAELTAAVAAAAAAGVDDDAASTTGARADEPAAPLPEGPAAVAPERSAADDDDKPGNGHGRDRGNGGTRGRGDD